jgi:hypothetical protein
MTGPARGIERGNQTDPAGLDAGLVERRADDHCGPSAVAQAALQHAISRERGNDDAERRAVAARYPEVGPVQDECPVFAALRRGVERGQVLLADVIVSAR